LSEEISLLEISNIPEKATASATEIFNSSASVLISVLLNSAALKLASEIFTFCAEAVNAMIEMNVSKVIFIVFFIMFKLISIGV
jgi:hypothetical protein